jgi:hypothetical protein
MAIRNKNIKTLQNIFWIFAVYYGFSAIVLMNTDASRYAAKLYYTYTQQMTYSEIIQDKSMEDQESGYEVYEPVLTYLVSRVTGDYHVYFACTSFVFGFFYSRNISIILKRMQGNKNDFLRILLLVAFAMIIPIWLNGGVRFWTAAHIVLYGFNKLYLEKKKIGLLLMLVTPTIHFAFLYYILVYIIYLFAGNRFTVYYYLYLMTFMLKAVDAKFLINLLSKLSIFSNKIASYTKIDYIYGDFMTMDSVYNWYMRLYTLGLTYSMLICVMLLYKNKDTIFEGKKWLKTLICFGLMLHSTTYFISSIPSMDRFSNVASLFVYSGIIYAYNDFKQYRYLNLINIVMIPALIFYIFISSWNALYTMSIDTVLGNPILVICSQTERGLFEVVKSFF